MSNKRLFFALWPDNRQRDRLRDHIGPMAKLVEGQAVYRGDWHVTLTFIGDFPERLVPELLSRAAAVPFEPFRMRFDRVEFWPRPKVACLVGASTPPELESLVEGLNNVVSDFGVSLDDRRYRPHITVVRRARPFETQRLAQPALVEWSGFELIESVSERGSSSYYPVKQ